MGGLASCRRRLTGARSRRMRPGPPDLRLASAGDLVELLPHSHHRFAVRRRRRGERRATSRSRRSRRRRRGRGPNAMLAARSGRPSSPLEAQRRLHLERGRTPTARTPGLVDPAGARRDVVERRTHDRDPRISETHHALEVASVQRPRDPQWHAAGLQRLRLAVDVLKRQRGGVELAGVSRHSTRHAARVSVSSWPRCSKSIPSASYSSRCHPVPTPRSSRPRESTSSVAACFASSTAGRSGAIRMPVASRTRDVADAIAASTISGSNQGASAGPGTCPTCSSRCAGPSLRGRPRRCG